MTTADIPLLKPGLDPTPRPITEPSPLATLAKKTRLHSLDVFRGITLAGMLLVNNIGRSYAPLEHVEWNGWTPTDLVFPFFLFIVGVAIPFSLASRRDDPEQTRGWMLGKIWLRALALFMLGELLFAFPTPMTNSFPAGFPVYRALRIFSFVFIYGSIIALLVPWRSRKVATILPLAITVIFYTLLIVVHYVQKSAGEHGWPNVSKDGIFQFGGGVFSPHNLRIPGVLQRIGIVYGCAATIALLAGWRTILVSAFALCALYAALMFKVPFPGHTTGSLTFEDNLARSIDVAVFDRFERNADGSIAKKPNGAPIYRQHHTYSGYPDNEGLLSTIPAISTSLIGILVGLSLRRDRPAIDRCAAILALGVPVTILGACLDSWLMPINKILWTPSYVVFTAGLAMLGLGFVFWLVDVLGRKRWAFFFTVFGVNAIAAYVAASIAPRLLNLIKVGKEDQGLVRYLQSGADRGFHSLSDWLTRLSSHLPVLYVQENKTIVSAMVIILLVWLLMLILYVFKIYVKV